MTIETDRSVEENGVMESDNCSEWFPVRAVGVKKRFRLGRRKDWNEVLHGVDFAADIGEFVSIVGPSGSGKSTLLYCLSGLEKADDGKVMLNGADITRMSRQQVSVERRASVGFIFQDYNLIDSLTGQANVELSLRLAGKHMGKARELARESMHRLGIEHLSGAYPSDMSGGERQRVAIARTLACSPKIVFADEPTGALDSKNAQTVFGLLRSIASSGTTVVMVTHSLELAARTDRVVVLRDGLIVDSVDNPTRASLARQIQ
ncbi:MAG: ABC transporter ATP-binding protein [Bifidobacteriaceae bacterium]|nr:ABC transporter ATP-binding protein [Bifidobacteriaceae bacterium]